MKFRIGVLIGHNQIHQPIRMCNNLNPKKRELAATAYLEVFSPGKIIIKEEGLPERYYMVLCGQGLRAKSLRLPAGNVQLKSKTGSMTGSPTGSQTRSQTGSQIGSQTGSE